MLALGAFSLTALIRLAYFNVSEELRQDQTAETRKIYSGMPVTTSAYIFPILFLLRGVLKATFPIVYGVLIAVCAVLFIAPIKVKKPGKNTRRVIAVVGAAVIILLIVTLRHKIHF